MGHNYKWNISVEKGIELAHLLIIDILRESANPTPLHELVNLLNSRSKYKLHNNKKHNCFSKYLKSTHGGVVSFLDDYNIYGIINDSDQITVVLLEDLLDEFDSKNSVKIRGSDNGWVFV